MRSLTFSRWKFCLLISGMLMVLSGCDFIYRILDEDGAEEKDIVGEYVPYQSNPTVQEVQALLKIYGYNPGRVDGILGLKTRNAIERFQVDQGLKVTRFIDDETWEALHIMQLKQLIKNQKLNIKFIQEILQATGFDPGGIDGKLGRQTTQAIKDFQTAHGLKADGKVGYRTLNALAQYVVID